MTNKIVDFRQADESLMRGDTIKQLPHGTSSNPTSYTSLATMTNEDVVAASIGQPDLLHVAKEGQLPAHMQSILDDQANGRQQGKRPRIEISGTPDPTLAHSGIVIGCKVYHKVRKIEGKVLDVSSTRAEVRRLDNNEKQWWDLKKIVKL